MASIHEIIEYLEIKLKHLPAARDSSISTGGLTKEEQYFLEGLYEGYTVVVKDILDKLKEVECPKTKKKRKPKAQAS